MNTNNYSYKYIVESVSEELSNLTQSDKLTFTEKELLQKAVQEINQSHTPILKIRKLRNYAEKLGSNSSLLEMLQFIKKYDKNTNLNYLLNLAKEDHIRKMERNKSVFPSFVPSKIDAYLNVEDTQELIEHLKKGVFDVLESEIVSDIKKTVTPEVLDLRLTRRNKNMLPLNESATLVKYNPVGIRYFDQDTDQTILLTESFKLVYDRDTNTYATKSDGVVPDSYRDFMQALSGVNVDPNNSIEFVTTKNIWDFNTCINKLGECYVWTNEQPQKKSIELEDLKKLFGESLEFLKANNTPQQEVEAYSKDADNYLIVLEHFDMLINFDVLEIIKNTQTGSAIIIPSSREYPYLVAGINPQKGFTPTQKSETFEQLTQQINQVVVPENENDILSLFADAIEKEKQFFSDKAQNLQNLQKSQSEINTDIVKLKQMQQAVEEQSPAYVKISQSLQELDNKLQENLQKQLEINKQQLY